MPNGEGRIENRDCRPYNLNVFTSPRGTPMIPPRWLPLTQLIAARLREFWREPEVIFWVYGFPLVLAVALGYAFSSTKPKPPTVDIQASPVARDAEALASLLNDEALGDEKPTAAVFPKEVCEERAQRGESALYLIVHPDKLEYVFDPARAESVQARYWIEAVLSRRDSRGPAAVDRHLIDPGRRYIDFLLPGLIGTNIMGGGLFGVGFVLVDMRVRKLFKRLLATPMRHSDFLLSLLISRLLFLIPEMASLLVVGHFWFEVPIKSPVALLVVIFVGAAAFAGIGLFLGSRTEKTETASGMINLVMLPQYILSGVFFSTKNFPAEAQPFIQALPLTQLIDAMREVMLEGKDLIGVSWRIGILVAYAVVTFALALRLFKWR